MLIKPIQLLKAIGIATLIFGGFALFIWAIVKYEKIAAIISLVIIFIFVVSRIYKDEEF